MMPRNTFSGWLLFSVAVAGNLLAADWPQFLGPTREGSSAETEKPLPSKFPPELPVLWSHKVGSGHSGAVFSEGKVILNHRIGDELVVEALDVTSGRTLWQQRFATNYRDSFGMDEGPRAVPSVAGGRVFVHHADGILQALELATGKPLWSVNTHQAFDSPQGFFGRASSPLVVGDKVLLTTGGSSAITAFDAASGKVLWSSGDDEASYASPVMLNERIVIAWLRNRLSTFAVADGKMIDGLHHRPSIEASVSAATPIRTVHGWFLSAEYDLGCSLWDVTDDGRLKKTWESTSLLNAHYATPVHHGGCVYGFDGRQNVA